MKKENKVHSFVMSDESVNSYGYRVLTEGGDLEQFKKNPVMLYSHDSESLPIGRWENLRVEEDRLIGDAVFDEGDERAMEIARKVEEGVIRCCSIGFEVLEVDDSEEMKKEGQQYITVTKWRLLECSLCAIGANRNAMTLSAGARVTLSVGRFRTNITNPKNEIDMTEQEIAALRHERDEQAAALEALRKENEELKATIERNREQEVERVLSAAVKEGRLSEGDKEAWRALMRADADQAQVALSKLPVRQSLSQMMSQGAAGHAWSGKSWDELDKSGHLLSYKAADPEGFKALYKQTFNTEYRED